MDSVVERLVSIYPGCHVTAFVLDKDIRELTPVAAGPKTGQPMGGRLMMVEQERLSLDERSIVGRVVTSGIPYMTNDTKKDGYYYEHKAFPKTRSELTVPVTLDASAYGIVDP